jgi:hypothetical protein
MDTRMDTRSANLTQCELVKLLKKAAISDEGLEPTLASLFLRFL